MAKPVIEIDGCATVVWRVVPRQRVTDLRSREVHATPGMMGGRFVPRTLGPSGIVLEVAGRQPGYELWTEGEKLEVWPKELVPLAEIVALDSAAQRLSTAAGKPVLAEIRRRPLTEEEFRVVQQERLIEANLARAAATGSGAAAQSPGPAGGLAGLASPAPSQQPQPQPQPCPVCGWVHDAQYAQFIRSGEEPIVLAGVLPDIVAVIHAALEKGLPRMSTKDDALLRRCGGYGNACKAFYDLGQRTAYRALFDTSRRGFIALRR